MALEINKVACATRFGNTGFGDCFFDPANLSGFFLVSSTLKLDKTAVAALQASLRTMLTNPKASRIFPVHNLQAFTDNSEDLVKQTLGYGGQSVVREGFNIWRSQFTNGGLGLLTELRKHNGKGRYAIFYDTEGNMLCYSNDSGKTVGGIPLEYFWALPFKANDGTNATQYLVEFCFDPKYVNDFGSFIQTDFDLSALTGVQDVNLEVVSQAANVIKIKPVTKISNVNLFEAGFDTELAAVGAWTARNKQTGATFTISSVAVDNTLLCFTITLDTTAFTALTAGDIVEVDLVSSAALKALGVEPYESVAPAEAVKA